MPHRADVGRVAANTAASNAGRWCGGKPSSPRIGRAYRDRG
jgi:hypothetical protein